MLANAGGAPVAGASVSTELEGGGDPEAFAQVVELLTWAAGPGLREAAAALQDAAGPAGGYSWADIARPLRINRQTAWERFGGGRQPRQRTRA